MFLSRSRSSVTLFVVFFILFQSLRLDANFLSSDNEKVLKSTVSLYTSGDPNMALNEKAMLEQSFQIVYKELIGFPLCSLRLLEDIDLVKVETDNADEAFFFLDFEMTLRCFDCFNDDIQLFNDDENDDYDNSWNLEEADNTCYWSGYYNYLMEDVVAERSVTNVAPSMKDFVKRFNEIIVMSQKMSNSIEEVRRVVSMETVFELEEPIPCPCSPRSYCSYTNFERNYFWNIPKTKGIYHNCTCRDGFSGEDGWRCDQIDECEDPENWPCAPPNEGGFCVNHYPDGTAYQLYECGCRSGFVANERYLPDKRHGITHCLQIDDNAEEEEDPSDNNVTFTITCDNEKLFPSVILVNVTGDPEAILDDKDKLEQAIKIAYEGALTSRCNFRTLEDVSLLGFSGDGGQFVELQPPATRRYLEEEETQENNAIADLIRSNDDVILDDDNGFLQISFNFSLFFSLIMRCFGCPNDALLFNDAFRRRKLLLRGNQRILQEDSCFCEIDDGSNETSEVANIAPFLDDFVEEFNVAIVEQGVDSIKEATDAEDKTDDPPTEEEADNNNTCNGKVCDEQTQFCNGRKCQCKAGFFSPSGVGGRCFDIKECALGQDMCHVNADCIEQIGSYSCSCKVGYSGNGENCMDINECELGKDDCNAEAIEICINTPGSFTCVLPTTTIPTREPTRNPTRNPTPNPTPLATSAPIPLGRPTSTPIPGM